MSFEDHLRSCSYCKGNNNKDLSKPKIKIKGASAYRREKKMAELGALVSGISYPGVLSVGEKKAKTKAASSISWIEKSQKLKELGRWIRGV
jgi:hypothetical protein